MLPLYPVDGKCGEVSSMPFKGFFFSVKSYPSYNIAQNGSIVPIKFETPGVNGLLSDILMEQYPQVAQVSCGTEPLLKIGATIENVGSGNNSVANSYYYNWNTSSLKPRCYEFMLNLIDGSYHGALFKLKSG
jgi:hypothetical protein